jgi:isoquinoline 1-oxidoreductase beta subunit
MLNAAIKACPVFTGKLAAFDAGGAPMPGVRAVVAVGTTPWPWWPTPGGRPRRRWTPCPSPGTRGRNADLSSADIDAMLDEGLTSDEQVFVGNANGDAKQASPAPRRPSRPSTPIPTRTTPPWSR